MHGVRCAVADGASGTLALRLGETVRLAIRPAHIHLFDADSGRRL